MKMDIEQYNEMLNKNNVRVIYSGPIWSDGIDSIAEVMKKRLDFDDVPYTASKSVFSIFVEQINNMMMYSAEKEKKINAESHEMEIAKGVFVLGLQGDTYFIQTGNLVTNSNAEILKKRIDHLNSLDKKQLRQYHKERLNTENDNPESHGAGIGLIEVARRSTSPIEYSLYPRGDKMQYFTVYLTVTHNATEFPAHFATELPAQNATKLPAQGGKL
ncbi:MAG: SiaB family protein kinase [Treponema sp.]|nr:SiaB family protein kinase [Treponema sp.]